MNALLSAALSYAGRGWCVLPTHSIRPDGRCSCEGMRGCKPGKHPRIRDWVNRATSDADQIREWWDEWSDANVGILTGHRSGIVVADIDCHGDSDGLARLVEWEAEHGPLLETMSVRTGGGGRHLYFSAPGETLPKGKLPNGMGDFLADRGFVLAPPSNHVSGGRYEVEGHTKVLAPLPDALRPTLTTIGTRTRVQQPTGTQGLLERPEVIPEFHRSNVLISLAGVMRRAGFTAKEIEAALLVANRDRGSPPLEDAEVRDIAESGGKYEALGARFNNGGVFWPREVEDRLFRDPDHHRLLHYLVNRAAWESEEWGVDRAGVGEVVQSLAKTIKACSWIKGNKKWEWSTSRITKLLDDLEAWGLVERVERRPRTRISILNYLSYQGFPAFPHRGSEQLRTRQEGGAQNSPVGLEEPAATPISSDLLDGLRTRPRGGLRTEDQVCVVMGGQGTNPDHDPTASILGEAR